MASLKKFFKAQAGWTTIEYIVGAIAIVTVVTAVVTAFQEPLKVKVTELVNSISAPSK